MKCKKCGAEIPQGYVYCNICGSEVQLVPDYNLLDEDLLSGMLQEDAVSEKKSSKSRKKKPPRTNIFIWGSICMILFIAVLTLFFVFNEIRIRQQNSYDYQFQKAEAYYSSGDLKQALAYYERALELEPQDRKSQNKLVEIYLSQNDEASAAAILETMVERDRQDRKSIQQLIRIYDEKKEYNKILALCKKVKDSRALELFADYIVEQPKFNNISGTYQRPLDIIISSDKNYDIFYTTDGSDPKKHGSPYKESIPLKKEGTTVITAVACNEKGIYSEPAAADYTIRYKEPDMPAVSPAEGSFTEPQTITIQVPPDCTAYYTWDGSDPTEGSFRYTGPLEMPMGNQVLSVILVNSAGLKSGIYRVNYVYMP